MNIPPKTTRQEASALVLLAVGLFAGCGDNGMLFVTPDGLGSQDDLQGRATSIAVRFTNVSNAAVDVEFFVAETPIEVVPEDLFVEANSRKRGIGVAGTGIIPPGTRDTIELSCNSDLTIGTTGGMFVDAETGDEFGQGDQRWVADNPIGLCGAIVTFIYDREGDSYTTNIVIDR